MARLNPYLFLFSVIALGACTALSAQSDQSAPPGHVKVIPPPLGIDEAAAGHVRTLPAPTLDPNGIFEINNHKSTHSIRVLSENEMTREDHDLLADAESSIQERAGVENLEFNGAGWKYRQLLCPALPKHLFLRFTRDDDPRQVSMFSVAIPRDGNGRVHIIPIVRKGYSLFSPAPIAALTMAAFNRIRAEEGEGASIDWLGTGLCYAALAGANPKLGDPVTNENAEMPAFIPPTLTMGTEGGAVIRFADISDAAKPMEWTMVFDARGKLVKATHTTAYLAISRKRTAGVVNVDQTK